MLRPFRVENLHGSEGLERSPEDKVIRLTAPTYDATISGNSRASLKYDDEEGDEVTVGSSLELEERLAEASIPTPRNPINVSATTGHLSSVGRIPEFHIEDQEDVQAVWNSLQLSSRLDHRTTTTDDKPESSPVTVPGPRSEPYCQLEDYRKLYFNSTNPPMLSWQKPGEVIKEFAKTSNETPSSTDAKLTPEGRRQARSAGDRLRARGPPLQPGLATLAPSDWSSHHSRWASYQNGAPSSTFGAPEMSLSACDRQGHDSTMTMDSQTKPLAEPSLEGYCDGDTDRQVASDRAKERFSENCTLINAIGKQDSATLDVPALPQKPLLELFEAELANKAKDHRNQDPASSDLLEAETQLRAFMSEDKFVDPTTSAGTKSPQLGSQSGSRKTSFTETERTCPAPQLEMNSRACSNSSKPVEEVIRTTVAGFETCLRGLVDVLQPHSPPDVSNTQLMDNALLTIQKFAELLINPKTGDHQDSPSPASEAAASPRRSNQQEMVQALNLERREPVQPISCPDKTTEKNGSPLRDSDIRQERRPSRSIEGSFPHHRNANVKEAGFAGDERMRHASSALDLSGPFRYHGPGPIHLPSYTTRYNVKRASSLRYPPKFEDASHLRRFQSTRFERKLQNQGDDARPRTHAAKEVKAMNPFAFPAVTTRFPTVAQFERSNHLQTSSQQNLIDLEETTDNARLQAVATSPSKSGTNAAHADRKSSNTAETDSLHDAQEVTSTHVEACHSNPNREREDDRSNTPQTNQSLDQTAFDVNNSTKVEPEKGHEESAFWSRSFEPPRQANHNIALNDAQATAARHSFNASAVPVTAQLRKRIEDAERPPQATPKHKQAMNPFGLGSDAARLTCPFDAFEPDPTNEVHSFSNVRRSATIADLRHAPSPRHRRPHTERYTLDYPVLPSGLEGTGDRQQRRPVRPLRNQWSPAVRFPPPPPPPPPPAPVMAQNQSVKLATAAQPIQESIQTQSQSISKAEIDYCVKQLLDLGFGHLAQDRLLMYAEATKGDLVESLDMISEDQRAEDVRRSAETGIIHDM